MQNTISLLQNWDMWWKDNEKNISPLVIGGLGGSGTRVIAQLVNDLGFYLGSHLNEPLDNLWFTFFLRRIGSDLILDLVTVAFDLDSGA